MKKNVYLYQVGVSFSSPVFLPYSAGCIAAYALSLAEIVNAFNIKDIIFRRVPPERNIDEIKAPAVVAFSTYIWNTEYNLISAKKIKEKFPDCLIVFGGHNIPEDSSFLEKYDFIDILMFGEGEESFAELLKAVNGEIAFSEVSNIVFRDKKGYVFTHRRYPCDLSVLPSPYLSGLFDDIFEKYPNTEFHATLETNRGCPYGCAYCDWCGTRKIREFPIEKIKKEIEWISENKIPYCYCADANFGILPRDEEIAEYVIEQRKKHGYPNIFKPCYAKDGGDTVFNAGKILNLNGADKGVTIAYQTRSEKVMKNIGRSNHSLKIFSDLEARFNKAGIPTYTEFILGLPEETYESFCEGLCSLLEAGQNNSMTVYECQLLPNSPLWQRENREKYGIGVSKIPLLGIHYNPEFNGVKEYFDIITETNTLSHEEWTRAIMFSIALQAFHHLGLLRCFAVYLRYEKNISYKQFYDGLLDYVYSAENTVICKLFTDLTERKKDTTTADWTYHDEKFGTTGYYFEEGVFLELLYSENEFWKEIKPFLLSFAIEGNVFEQLFEYQKNIIRRPFSKEIKVVSDYDFYGYFNRIDERAYSPLERKKTVIKVVFPETINSWSEYAKKIIWFGKRRSATLCTNKTENLTVEYDLREMPDTSTSQEAGYIPKT